LLKFDFTFKLTLNFNSEPNKSVERTDKIKVQHTFLLPLYVVIVLSAASLGATAQAQEAQEFGAARMLEEIVVTARRREEGLQEGSIAISAYTGDAMAYRGANRLDDISRFVPSLTLENNPSFGGAFDNEALAVFAQLTYDFSSLVLESFPRSTQVRWRGALLEYARMKDS